ncbi:terminase [Frankia sp. AgB1.9]|uniref:terminase large subunit n=1 Tax=unclassified Frankia TaxID=2632575 RepID=UPI00193414F8|nr:MULTISPECIES: terminase large subunit [unclassified Frankia]MBL7494462.1 terminase [Frankia sp. AgW1.1]MBL7546634.1 terminase [Frankia sp. AgB1.9]MBL7622380.1 hypothetical protein [Frankia sp. AgB1.8]
MTTSPRRTDGTAWERPPELAAQLQELYGLACPPLWGMPRRLDRPTLGGKAAKVMTRLGYPPMPWQRYTLDVALEIDPATGLLAYRNVGLSVMRQQGKTQELLGVKVHRAAAWRRQRVIYAAQTRSMARERLQDEWLPVLDSSQLRGRYRPRLANGNEAIIWQATRSKIGITANTEEAGHGPPLDLGVIDEAFAHQDARLEQAMSPAMLTRPNAQLWWASAGGTEKSVWLNGKRETGRALVEALWRGGLDHASWPRTAYFEWYAPDDLPRDDPATWRGCMPALGYTVTEDVIRGELEKFAGQPGEFDRAYLNRTRKAEPAADLNIPTAEWTRCVDRASKPGTDIAIAIDVSPRRDWASIGAAALRPDGKVHLELVDRRSGTDWIVPAALRIAERRDVVTVAVDRIGPAGALLDDLRRAGLTEPDDPARPRRGELIVPGTRDVTAACGQFADAVRAGDVVHLDQGPLTAALNGARTRPLGDAWAWTRRAAQVDITPLVTVTLARWALLTRLPALVADYDPLDSIY